MFLNPSRLKTQGAFAVGAVALIASCSDPEARTDLRPEGDPEVLAVLVLNDSVSGLYEAATFCKPGDEKRPGLVGLPDFTTTQICPEDLSEAAPMVTDASPDTFYVRIMFDELLDPDIEDLIEVVDDDGQPTGQFEGSLARTQPVTLRCTGVDGAMHDVPYDGYYSPSGNKVTWPLGPSLVIKQTGEFIIPTNSMCEVSLKDNVVDKQGNPIPAAQRGPYRFQISGLKPLLVDPSDESAVDAFAIYFDNVYAQFNGEVQVPSICTDNGTGIDFFGLPPTFAAVCKSSEPVAFNIDPLPAGGGLCSGTFTGCATNADCTAPATCDYFYAYSLFPFGLSRQEFAFGPISPLETEKEYTFTLTQGAMLQDRCGVATTLGAPSAADQTSVTFTTNPFKLNTAFSINNNDTVPANRKVRLPFSNVIDLSSITPGTEFTMDPPTFADATTPLSAADMLSTSTGGNIFIQGFYKPDTEYTFTLKAGATIADVYGAEYTHAADTVIKFKTQPIALTAATASGTTFTKATPTSITTISFTFNQDMDVSTFTMDDIEFIGTPTTLSLVRGASPNTCLADGTGCQLRVRGVFAPGEYEVKLKATAQISDVFGNVFTPAAERSIKFTVQEATPAPVIPCLGAN